MPCEKQVMAYANKGYECKIFIYLLIIELVSGMIWAGFNLAAGNFIYDVVTRQRMAICTSYFNIISGFGVLLGATLGGILSSHKVNIFGLHPILFVFLLDFHLT